MKKRLLALLAAACMATSFSPTAAASVRKVPVTVDGVTHSLPRPFMVMATQNPVDFVGTYPLPEAQMDRFFLRIAIGYPSIEEEMDVLERYSAQVTPMQTLSPVCGADEIIAMHGGTLKLENADGGGTLVTICLPASQ